MAPGANILFVGAQDCLDSSLLAALTHRRHQRRVGGQRLVGRRRSVTCSTDAATKTAFDDTFMLADSTGVSVLFSSGDDGDNFADFGLTAPDYPPTSPFVTAVGGTTLEVNSEQRPPGRVRLVDGQADAVRVQRPRTAAPPPPRPARWPGRQAVAAAPATPTPSRSTRLGVVPTALALRNEALFGPVPLRVVPGHLDGR